jgi:CubicO group peptidase (beta-lactamase class C family)
MIANMVATTAAETLIDAAPEDVGMSSARLGNVSRLIKRYVDEARLPGGSCVVARRGRVVHCELYGEMDAERHAPMQIDTIFRIASMTKPIASVALMMLYEEGCFQLDDPLGKFIPELSALKVIDGGTADDYRVRDAVRQITIRDLLTHTAGLSHRQSPSVVGELYRRAGFAGHETDFTLAECVAKLARMPLQVDPGTAWIYSIATDVVGYLCEVISGQTFDRYLDERIFRPLGMPDTGFCVPPASVHRFAANYGPREGKPAYQLIDDPATSTHARPRKYLSGAGGLVSTLPDYLRFCRMLVNGGELDQVRILGPRTLQLVTSNHLPAGKDVASMARDFPFRLDGWGFGLGFAVMMDPVAAQLLSTPGECTWGGAATTEFFINPAEELVVMFFTQLVPSTTYPIGRELHATVYSAIID